MKNNYLTAILLLLITFLARGVNAQSGIHSAGFESTGSNGKVSASIGQVFVNTNSSGSYYSIEGVQQPYEISVITSNEELPEIAEQITVFPNPFNEAVNIKFENGHGNNKSYVLVDMNGKPVRQGNINAEETEIDAAFMVKGTYLLSVISDKTLVKSFKIVKN